MSEPVVTDPASAATRGPADVPVGVLGAGSVGGSLARALLASGHPVTVWNRTPERCEPLAEDGVTIAATPAVALGAAEVLFVALVDYAAAHEVLSRIPDDDLADRLIVQMSSGSPEQAVGLGDLVRSHGGRYVDGLLYSYPSALFDESAILFLAGEEADFETLRTKVFRSLRWDVEHVEEDLRWAKQISNQLEAATTLAVEGFLLGAALADAAGMSVGRYADLVIPRYLPTLEALVRRCVHQVETGDYAGEMTLELWRHGVARQAREARALGVDAACLDVVADQMGRAVSGGFGGGDIAAMFESIRHLKATGRNS